MCSAPKIIEEIINNNNKQNEILPSDLRSNDKQQVRLRKEFEKFSQLYYSGGRRDSTRVSMPLHSTLEPAIVGGLKSKEATQNATKQLRAVLASFSAMYAQQLKPFSNIINTDM